MSYRSFHWNGSRFVSYHDQFDPSPVRIVTSTAVQIMQEGLPLELPEGITFEILDEIAWNTGYYNTEVNVGGAHAFALLSIAEQLLDSYSDRLRDPERVRYMISVIKSAA